jgi:hypothetical protein
MMPGMISTYFFPVLSHAMTTYLRYPTIVFILAISGFVLESCEKPAVFEDDELIMSLYRSARDTLSFEGSHYILETELYRNLMPGGPVPEKRPLISIVYVVNMDSLDISDEWKADKLYVIHENLIYACVPDILENSSQPDFKQSYICREGPEWETDIIVDVVLKFTDQSTGEIYYLISRDQVIQKIW